MRTILAAKESIAQLWGHPKPKDTAYRLMKYLLRVEVEDGVLLHNCVTRQLILLSKEEAELLANLPAKPTEPMQELIANHFLVPNDFDEYRSVKQLRTIYQKRNTGESINHYIVLPTTFCNARCFYCYENDYPHIHMTEETASKLVGYIDEHRKGKDVLISWFGGEPLVGIKRIDQISQELKDCEIPFTASMISNGYLFDEEVVERALNLWNLKRVQITLDGTEEVYNRVKAYVNVKDNPFQRVFRNIDLLSDQGIQVNIRLNVDFYNKDDILVLIDDLGKRYSGNPKISVYMNVLFNDEGFEPVHHSADDLIELARIIDDYIERLKKYGIAYDNRIIPSLKVNQCMADNPHAIEIQPDGSFCRCEHEDVSMSYGNLDEGILDPQTPLRWREIVDRSDYCSDCSLYPSCYVLKHCFTNNHAPCLDYFRNRELDRTKDLLQTVFKKKLEVEDHENICGS